jgi:transposase
VISVQLWAEVRRMRFVEGLAIREIRRRTGLHRETIRRALRSKRPPSYSRPPRGSKLDPFKDEVHRPLDDDPRIETQRIRELSAEQGFDGGKTIVDDYVRDVRPYYPGPAHLPADGLPPGGAAAVRPLAAERRDPGRLRPDA